MFEARLLRFGRGDRKNPYDGRQNARKPGQGPLFSPGVGDSERRIETFGLRCGWGPCPAGLLQEVFENPVEDGVQPVFDGVSAFRKQLSNDKDPLGSYPGSLLIGGIRQRPPAFN